MTGELDRLGRCRMPMNDIRALLEFGVAFRDKIALVRTEGVVFKSRNKHCSLHRRELAVDAEIAALKMRCIGRVAKQHVTWSGFVPDVGIA